MLDNGGLIIGSMDDTRKAHVSMVSNDGVVTKVATNVKCYSAVALSTHSGNGGVVLLDNSVPGGPLTLQLDGSLITKDGVCNTFSLTGTLLARGDNSDAHYAKTATIIGYDGNMFVCSVYRGSRYDTVYFRADEDTFSAEPINLREFANLSLSNMYYWPLNSMTYAWYYNADESSAVDKCRRVKFSANRDLPVYTISRDIQQVIEAPYVSSIGHVLLSVISPTGVVADHTAYQSGGIISCAITGTDRWFSLLFASTGEQYSAVSQLGDYKFGNQHVMHFVYHAKTDRFYGAQEEPQGNSDYSTIIYSDRK